MSPIDRRISRLLLIVLGVVVAVGSITLIYKMNASRSKGTLALNPPATQSSSSLSSAVSPATAPSAIDASRLPEITQTPGALETSGASTNSGSAIVPNAASSAAVSAASTLTRSSEPVSSLLADAQAKIDGGHILEARDRLNSALKGGQLSESQATAVKAMMTQISQTTIFGRQRFSEDPYGLEYVVESGDSLSRIANAHDLTWEFLGRINGIDPKRLRSGATIKIIQGPFFAVVQKQKFAMDVYLGGLPDEKSSLYVTTFPVGLGRDDSTPTGIWTVEPHKKLKNPTYYSPRGEGVIGPDDPKNPLGGFWIGLEGTNGEAKGKLSYGIHGTIDPESIGKQSSMGCIRLRNQDIAVVYDLMTEGKSQVLVK